LISEHIFLESSQIQIRKQVSSCGVAKTRLSYRKDEVSQVVMCS
jgi:hypothetical protein